jgi:hypothetical protein
MSTPAADTTVIATKTTYATFQASIDRLKSWARAVKAWISDTFSPLSLACSLAILCSCLVVEIGRPCAGSSIQLANHWIGLPSKYGTF